MSTDTYAKPHDHTYSGVAIQYQNMALFKRLPTGPSFGKPFQKMAKNPQTEMMAPGLSNVKARYVIDKTMVLLTEVNGLSFSHSSTNYLRIKLAYSIQKHKVSQK